jgi:NAD(P)-dependent dehydrogenase (short-subunit alcohol dehydrogenase family)
MIWSKHNLLLQEPSIMSDYVSKLFNLKGKTAVVIGGAGHLCSVMAEALAKSGVNIVLADKNEQGRQAIVKKLKKISPQVIDLSIDVTQKEQHKIVLEAALKRFKQVDILINGAGINAPTPVMDITVEEWRAIFDSHATATLLGCQVFGKHMIGKRSGSIINLSSASSGPPLSKAFSYSVAKAGVKNLTQNLAREWAPYNVRVNALRPGFFPTAWSMKHFIDAKRKAAILGHTPMGRFGTPQELVGAVLWLASDASGFVTGSEVHVDGGFTCMTI